MPERSEYYENGRFLYYVPTCAVQRDTEGNDFIYTAREYEDVLGQRNIVTKILIRVIETKEDKTLIDGIVQEEPIITEDASVYMPLQPVLIEEEAVMQEQFSYLSIIRIDYSHFPLNPLPNT